MKVYFQMAELTFRHIVALACMIHWEETTVTGPGQRTGVVGEGGPAHPDDTCGGALQPRWRTGSPSLLDRCDEKAWREEQSSPTFDLQ